MLPPPEVPCVPMWVQVFRANTPGTCPVFLRTGFLEARLVPPPPPVRRTVRLCLKGSPEPKRDSKKRSHFRTANRKKGAAPLP